MLSRLLNLLSQWENVRLSLQNIYIQLKSFLLQINTFRLNINEDGHIHMNQLNLDIENSCIINMNEISYLNIQKNVEINGCLVVDKICMKQNNEIYEIYIDENKNLKINI
jgi:hypothetical protein